MFARPRDRKRRAAITDPDVAISKPVALIIYESTPVKPIISDVNIIPPPMPPSTAIMRITRLIAKNMKKNSIDPICSIQPSICSLLSKKNEKNDKNLLSDLAKVLSGQCR